jgi:hypothetical protein
LSLSTQWTYNIAEGFATQYYHVEIVWRCGGLVVWRWELWRCGWMDGWRCGGDVELWRCEDVEVWRCGGLEVWR